MIVSGTAVTGSADPKSVINKLRKAVNDAVLEYDTNNHS